MPEDTGTPAEGEQHWTCPECGEEWGSKDRKVPGGCVGCVEMLRYIEYNTPEMAILENAPAAVVCQFDGCEETISVDPETLVVEDEDAVELDAEVYDIEAGQSTGHSRIDIYCSPECRNDDLAEGVPDDAEVPEGVLGS